MQKQFGDVRIKNADKGEFTAVFATFNVVDKDGDVTTPGAFTDGEEVVVSAYGHESWSGVLPVGKARIRQTNSEAIAEGQFFLDTSHGRDTFETVKQLGNLGQWSYGFDVVDSDRGDFNGKQVRYLRRMKVHEVSPVLIGAGVNTRTLVTKQANESQGAPAMDVAPVNVMKVHYTPTTTRTWDVKGVTDLLDDASIDALRAVHVWVDPAGDPEVKESYRFAHHHGPDGPANIKALYVGIAEVNLAAGVMPEPQRKAVYEHLASHLRDADREPPPFRADGDELKFHDEMFRGMAVLKELVEGAERVVALRAQRNKKLSNINAEALAWFMEDYEATGRELKRLFDTPQDVVANEFARFIALTYRPGGDHV
jgi:HK97 family phage prohead protease